VSDRGVVLPPAAVAFVQKGGRDLPLALAGTAAPLEAGRPLRLVGPTGQTLGLALADPENDRLRVLIAPDEPFDALDAAFFAARVEAALERRRGLGLVGRDRAFRLLNGAGDGLPGLVADVYAGWAVLHVHARALVPCARELASVLIGGADLQGVVLKLRTRGSAARGELAQEVHGASPPERLVVSEGELRFETHPLGGLNVGLFTDMREQREALGRLATGRTVLNGFSYTGSLSVAAAKGGAAGVTSVDLSRGVQRWARDNFRHNGLHPESPAFRFEVGDVGRYLDEATQAGTRFDLVLLDPPAFSAARGAGFAIDRDYPDLIAKACRLVPEGGMLWLACNARTSSLLDLAAQGTSSARRPAVLLEQGGLPPDHPTLPAQPEDRYLQVALLRLG
jgi:23S rRNA (cytosine1962-C5)-methyltransferase